MTVTFFIIFLTKMFLDMAILAEIYVSYCNLNFQTHILHMYPIHSSYFLGINMVFLCFSGEKSWFFPGEKSAFFSRKTIVSSP